MTKPKSTGALSSLWPWEGYGGNTTGRFLVYPCPVQRLGFSVYPHWRQLSWPNWSTWWTTSYVSCDISESSGQGGDMFPLTCLQICLFYIQGRHRKCRITELMIFRLGWKLALGGILLIWYLSNSYLHCTLRLKAGGERDDRGWDDWMAPPTQWTWVSAGSGSWWWAGKPGVLSHIDGKYEKWHNNQGRKSEDVNKNSARYHPLIQQSQPLNLSYRPSCTHVQGWCESHSLRPCS